MISSQEFIFMGLCAYWYKLSLQLQAQFVLESTYLPRKRQQCFLVQLLFFLWWNLYEDSFFTTTCPYLILYSTSITTIDIPRLHSSSNMDHCGTNWAYKPVVKWRHFNIDDLSRSCFMVFRTKNDDAALIFIIFESMRFRVHFDGGSILKTILTSF